MKKYIFSMLVIFPIGCGGGGSSSGSTSNSTNESAAGIWEGSGTTSTNVTTAIAGLIASNGKAFFLTALPALVYGDVSVSGRNLNFSGSGFDEIFPDPESVTMSGTVETGSSITVSYSTPDESGTISLSKASSTVGVYDRSSSLSKLQGTWNDAITDAEGTWVFTISSAGTISAIRVTDNCSMNGEFATINVEKNEYAVTATVTSCNESNGNYSGLAFTSDANTFTDNVITIAITNDLNAGFFEATKQ